MNAMLNTLDRRMEKVSSTCCVIHPSCTFFLLEPKLKSTYPKDYEFDEVHEQ